MRRSSSLLKICTTYTPEVLFENRWRKKTEGEATNSDGCGVMLTFLVTNEEYLCQTV